MKNTIIFLSLFLLSTNIILAQSKPETTNSRWLMSGFIGANTGSMFQGYGEGKQRTSYPSVSIAFDYQMKNAGLDLGFQIGTNKAVLPLDSVLIGNNFSGNSRREDVTISAWRTVIGFRMVFYYDKSVKSDVYSGFRTGLKFISRKTDTGYYNYRAKSGWFDWQLNEVKKKHTRLSTQLVLFGYRRYISEKWAIGTEIAFGAPYYAALVFTNRIRKVVK